MGNDIVDGGAYALREAHVVQRGRVGTFGKDGGVKGTINVIGGDAFLWDSKRLSE
jgi:hypothetical protein